MYRRDYIQQQLEEFGKFLAKLAGYKTNKRYQDFEIEIEVAAQTFIGKGLKDIDALEEQHLKAYLTSLEISQKKILARLFFERMQLCDELNQVKDATEFAKKSLVVYQVLNRDQTSNEYDLDVHYKLEILSDRLNSNT